MSIKSPIFQTIIKALTIAIAALVIQNGIDKLALNGNQTQSMSGKDGFYTVTIETDSTQHQIIMLHRSTDECTNQFFDANHETTKELNRQRYLSHHIIEFERPIQIIEMHCPHLAPFRTMLLQRIAPIVFEKTHFNKWFPFIVNYEILLLGIITALFSIIFLYLSITTNLSPKLKRLRISFFITVIANLIILNPLSSLFLGASSRYIAIFLRGFAPLIFYLNAQNPPSKFGRFAITLQIIATLTAPILLYFQPNQYTFFHYAFIMVVYRNISALLAIDTIRHIKNNPQKIDFFSPIPITWNLLEWLVSIGFYFHQISNLISPAFMLLCSIYISRNIYLQHKNSKKELLQAKIQIESEEHNKQNILRIMHDIRSPLGALNAIASNLPVSDQETKQIFSHSLSRLNNISNNILHYNRNNLFNTVQSTQKLTPTPISQINSTIESIIAEKRFLHGQNEKGFIQFNKDRVISEINTQIEIDYFARIISNLLENAIEASGENVPISLELFCSGNRLEISLCNQGTSIDSTIANQLNAGRAISSGKINGNGIGFSSALKVIESWNGKLTISPVLNPAGTLVKISLPIHNS